MSRSIAQGTLPKLLNLQTIFSRSSSSSSSTPNKFQNRHLRRRRKWLLSSPNTHHQKTFNQQEALRSLKQTPIPTPTKTHLLSSLIDSFAIFNCDPTPDAYKFVIKTLTQTTSQCHQLPAVLDRLEKLEEFETPESIFVCLIRFYGGMNKFQEAVDVFLKIPNFRCRPTVDSLDCLLSVLCEKREGLEIVPQVLVKSRLMNVRLEESSFRVLIRGLCRAKKGENAVELYHMVDNDIGVDGESFSLILSTLCEQKGLSCVEVMGYLEEMRKFGFCLGRADWGNVIRLLLKNGMGLDAYEALHQMKLDGTKPDVVCYTMVMDGVIREGDYEKADELFDEMLVLGLVPDIYTYNVFVNGLCKQRKFDAALVMIQSMEEIGCKPNLITYNTLLRAMCELKVMSMAREVLKRMRVNAVKLNLQSYEIMICGLVSKGEVFEARGMFEEMMRNDLLPRSSTLDEIICAMCQKGLLVEALDLVTEMVGKNVVPGARSWEALIVGFKCKTIFSLDCFDQLEIPSN